MTQTIHFQSQIDAALLEAFAHFTGDRSSLHFNEEFARKTRFRERIAHGMLPLCYLGLLQNRFPQQAVRLLSLEAQFKKPIHLGQTIAGQIEIQSSAEGTTGFVLTIWHGQTELTRVNGQIQLADVAAAEIASGSEYSLLKNLEEKNPSLAELENRKAEFSTALPAATPAKLLEALNQALLSEEKMRFSLPAELEASLLLSTIVGMEIPGRKATFASFSLKFENPMPRRQEFRLSAAVKKLHKASERLDIECQLSSQAREIFAGSMKALANAEAQPGLGCDEIRQKYLSLGLHNKVALVTGASRGIGEATAKLLAMQGCRVIVNYRKGEADAEKIVADIIRNGGQAMAFGADISDEKQVQNMIKATLEKWGRIDILVNNAVRDFQSKPLLETDWSDYLGELDVSLRGLHNVCKAVIPSMRENGAGKIVNLASILTEMPIVGQNKYITIKNAVIGYTRSLAVELLQNGIQVNALLPNMTETSLLSHISRAYLEKIGSERGFGRNLQPIEVAQNIVYLVSDWSTPMTGQRVILNLGEAPYL